LLLTSFTTWEIPANSKPMPNIIITNTAVCTGYPTAIEPKMRASTPSPTVPQRDLFFTNIPLIIFSIPTMMKIMPAKYTPHHVNRVFFYLLSLSKGRRFDSIHDSDINA
jgi:hypothetical protein